MPLLADHLYTTPKIPVVGGLLTTIDSLPAVLKRQYTSTTSTAYKPKSAAIKRSALSLETPLDLTVKSHPQFIGFSSITPPSTPSPPKKRYKFLLEEEQKSEAAEAAEQNVENNPPKEEGKVKRTHPNVKVEAEAVSAKKDELMPKNKQVTPKKPIQAVEDSNLKMGKSTRPGKKQTRNKATRKLKFDEDTSSPVSGTIIRRLEEIEDEDQIGDIDPEYNIVEVTEEAKAEIAAITNVIGEYLCKLCRKLFDDAFELAQHRCCCIVLLEYRCPECGKRFNCPANLASHRRWHKPRPSQGKGGSNAKVSSAVKYSCRDCKKTFKRLAYLTKHQKTHNQKNKSPEKQVEDSEHSQSNGSFYSGEEQMKVEYEVPEYQNPHNSKLQTFTQIVFRYASNLGHDDNVVYSPLSRGSTPESLCSSPSSSTNEPQKSRAFGALTEDENLAAAALAALGHNGPSVIRHTTLTA